MLRVLRVVDHLSNPDPVKLAAKGTEQGARPGALSTALGQLLTKGGHSIDCRKHLSETPTEDPTALVEGPMAR